MSRSLRSSATVFALITVTSSMRITSFGLVTSLEEITSPAVGVRRCAHSRSVHQSKK